MKYDSPPHIIEKAIALGEQVVEHAQENGVSQYRICAETNMRTATTRTVFRADHPRRMNMGLLSFMRVCDAVGLEIVLRPKQ
jgi:hypothetical protein